MTTLQIEELKKLLQEKKHKLSGKFVLKNSSYDGDICKILGIYENTCRYWDAEFLDLKIEFKKGKNIWIDLVRYSESYLKANNESSFKTITLFFIPDKEKLCINEIIGIDTNKLIGKFNFDPKIAISLIELNKNVPRSLNIQANLTLKDIRELADFIV